MGCKYTPKEMDIIRSNLHKGSRKIVEIVHEKLGINRTMRAIIEVCRRNGWSIENQGVKKPQPMGHSYLDKGKYKRVKTENGYRHENAINAELSDGEVTTVHDGQLIILNRAEHMRMIKNGYYTAPKELKKSLELMARVDQKAYEVMQ